MPKLPGSGKTSDATFSGRDSSASQPNIIGSGTNPLGESTKQNNYLSALFRRLAARRGVKRATIAVAHALLVIAYEILKRGVEYCELGADYFDRLNPHRLTRRLVKRLEGLGFQVTSCSSTCIAIFEGMNSVVRSFAEPKGPAAAAGTTLAPLANAHSDGWVDSSF